MNERIKELANRAMVEREDGWHEFDANVFAELIVSKCLKEIKDMIIDESEQLYPNNKKTTECVNDRLLDAHDNILEHFGVKE